MMSPNDLKYFVEKILGLNPRYTTITQEEIEEIVFPKKNMKILGTYGKGEFGLVLKIQNITNPEQIFALRLSKFVKDVERSLYEYRIQKKFATYQMAPDVFQFDVLEFMWRNQPFSVVRAMMEPIQITLSQYITNNKNIKQLYSPFECLLKKKFLLNYPNPYLHGDMHIDNIVILKDGKTLGFIDFGWTIKAPFELQILDCIPVITSLKIIFPQTRNTLIKHLISFYDSFFNVKLNYDYFTNHPLGGYTYKFKKFYLHSYNWGVRKVGAITYYGLPSENYLKEAFPTLETPEITE